ncbi:MAG: hypothetical protein WC368_04120, partial [Candidatus Cloacimonadaceae bacterium]
GRRLHRVNQDYSGLEPDALAVSGSLYIEIVDYVSIPIIVNLYCRDNSDYGQHTAVVKSWVGLQAKRVKENNS